MGTRPFSFSDVDAFLAPSPRPSPLDAIDAFLAQPTPSASPLDNLFDPQPSPTPLSTPPQGPDVVDLPGQEEPQESMLERIQRVLAAATAPIPAIEQAMQRDTSRMGVNLETSDKDPGRPLNLPGPEFLPRDVRAALRGATEGLLEEAVPGLTTPLDLATLPTMAPTRALTALGKGGSALYRAARAAEVGGGALLGGEGAREVVEGAAEGDLARVGGGAFRAGMGGLMARGPGTLAGRVAEEAPPPVTAEAVARLLAQRRAPLTGGRAAAMEGPDRPPGFVEPPPPDPNIAPAIRSLRIGGGDKGGAVFQGTEFITRHAPGMDPGKVELGLEDFPEGAKTIADALQRIAEGKKSALGERALAAIKKHAEKVQADEADRRVEAGEKRVKENVAAGRASFDPDALELPPIEGSAHGVDDDYSGIVLGAAETHLGPVQGRGVVSTTTQTGQKWYGFKGEDGKVSAAFSIQDGVARDWAGSGPGTGLVIRQALKDGEFKIDFDSLSEDSARVLNRVMNSGTKIGENVRVQYEAHLAERAGGTVPPGGTDGLHQGVGPGGSGGRGGGSGGKPPETVVEPSGTGGTPEGAGGGGSGAPPGGPPSGTGGVAPEPDDPVRKLIGLIRQAPRAIKETEALRMPERIRRARELQKAVEAAGGGEEGLFAAKRAISGEMPRSDFDAVRPALSEDEVRGLFQRVWKHPEIRWFEKMRGADALYKILDAKGGRVPQTNEIATLERIFGEDLAEAVLSRRNWKTRGKEELIGALNLPRSIVSSYDMSAPFRQGLLLTVGHPVIAARAGKHMFQAAFSPKVFDDMERSIRARPNAELYDSTGLYLAGRHLSTREEAYMSRLAEKIPLIGAGVRGSERAFVGYLNKLRADVFDSIAGEWQRAGHTPETSPSRYKGLAEYINMATGRGHLGKLERIAPMMNAAFFSPRFMMARLQSLNPVTYARMDPAVRKEAARNMASTLGAGIAIISLAKMAGADVEVDPRSSDFGKIRVGRTRIDVWGGFQQPMRYLVQIATKQRKPEQGGIQPLKTRKESVGRFLRSKLAPVPSSGYDLDEGKDMTGKQVTLESEALELFSPMFLADFIEAVQEHGFIAGGAIAAPAFFGVGVTTHTDSGRPR